MKELLLGIHKRTTDGGKGSGFFGYKCRKGRVGVSASSSNTLSKPLNHQQVAEILKDEVIVKQFGNYSSVFKKLSLNNNGVVARINRVIEGGQGIFKSQDDRDKAEELRDKMKKEGLEDTAEYKKIDRGLEQDNYLAALYEVAEEKFGDKADSNNKRERLTLEQEKLIEEVDKIEYQYYGDEGDIKKPQDSPINNEPTNSLDNKPEETDNQDNQDKPKKNDVDEYGNELSDYDRGILNLIREANGK